MGITRRDLQGLQKKMGRPWEIGKAFERSAPCGPLHPDSEVGHLDQGHLESKVDGELRQEAWPEPDDLESASDDLLSIRIF